VKFQKCLFGEYLYPKLLKHDMGTKTACKYQLL